MICCLDEISVITSSVNEQAVNTVIGFNIVKQFISSEKEIAVHIFVGTDIQRIFKDTGRLYPLQLAPYGTSDVLKADF